MAANHCDPCQSTNSIDLSDCNIHSLSEAINKSCSAARSAQSLNLKGNFTTNISSNDFKMQDNTGYFWRLSKLNLSNNSIVYVAEDAFLILLVLEHLDLSNNNIKELENGILQNKPALRIVDFSYNQINFIGSHVFTKYHIALKEVHLAHNKLVSIEPWPYIPPILRKFDVSYNLIVNFTNRMNWTYNLEEPYHASADLRHNQFTFWNDGFLQQYNPNSEDFYIDIVTYNVDLRDNPWFCDCKLHEVLRRYQNSLIKYAYSNMIEVKCNGPPELKGKSFVEDVDLNDLICNVTKDCPQNCLCQDKPDDNMFHVNCDNGDHTSLPSQLPEIGNKNLKLEMNNNHIKTLSSRNYTSHITELSLSGNGLQVVEVEAIENMKDQVHLNLENNNLQSIPDNIQFKTPYEKVELSKNPFKCTCDMVWMAEWINLAPEDNPNRDIQCTYKKDDFYKIREVTERLLDCAYDVAIGFTIGFAILLTLVIVAVVWAKRCPYETKVILFRFFRYHPWDKYRVDRELVAEYDAYVSFDDTNIHIRQWVLKKFVKRLEEEKPCYKFFVPIRNLIAGEDKADGIINNMEKSKRVIIILSDKYDENEWCKFECQRAEILELNNGRVIFIRYHPEAGDMIENEPWKSRVKGRKVFSPGEKKSERRWFWGKIKYELPTQ
ncbi:protein toll-like [Saccostrea echinata]|uniref:protein toll-like n=1 Tax=Saccostrea echinata TaxID=191078 RepID=UPI002A81007D|nr:protein toll-like [Saccostrea echinata]